jgi:hypothetical protein
MNESSKRSSRVATSSNEEAFERLKIELHRAFSTPDSDYVEVTAGQVIARNKERRLAKKMASGAIVRKDSAELRALAVSPMRALGGSSAERIVMLLQR